MDIWLMLAWCAEFLYPAQWLADQRLLYRAAERVQQQNPLDMPAPSRCMPLAAMFSTMCVI